MPTKHTRSGTPGPSLDAFLGMVISDVVNGPDRALCSCCRGAGTIEEATFPDKFGVWDTITWPCPKCDGSGEA